MSLEESILHQNVRKSSAALVQKPVTTERESLKSEAAGDSSSDEEEEYIGSLPPLEHAADKSRKSKLSGNKSKTKAQLGEKLRGEIDQARTSLVGGPPPEIQLPHQGLLPLEDLFPVESGRPCFIDGECQLCGRQIFCEGDAKSVTDAKIQTFGNPHCRGCSVVDALSFQRHPFSRLVLGADSGVKTAQLKAKPHVGKRLHPTFPLPPEAGEGFGIEALQNLKKVSDGREDDSMAAK